MKTLLTSLLLVLLLSLNSAAYAASQGISKQQAADIAMQSHPGRILGIKRKTGVYLVKTLNSHGKVHVVKVDAKTGKLLSGDSHRKQSGR